MPINWWMHRQNVMHACEGILFSPQKEGNTNAYCNLDKLQQHTQLKSSIKKKHIWPYLHKIFRKVKNRKAKSEICSSLRWPKCQECEDSQKSACVLEGQPLSHVWLFVTPGTVACQAPLSMGLSRQEYWCRLPCPPAGDLPDSGIEPESPLLQWHMGALVQCYPGGIALGWQNCLKLIMLIVALLGVFSKNLLNCMFKMISYMVCKICKKCLKVI